MEYKREPLPEDWPEWAQPGQHVLGKTTGARGVIRTCTPWAKWIGVEWNSSGQAESTRVDSVTPIELWNPEMGELVACWIANRPSFGLRPYSGRNSNGFHTAGHRTWDKIYRIPETWKNLREQNTRRWFERNSEELI